MNIFDILILGFLILGALQGYRRGLISGLVSLVGSILGFVLAAREYLRVLAWLDEYTPLRKWMESAVYKMILPSVEAQAQATQQMALERILSMIPQELRSLIGSGNIPDFQAYTQGTIQAIAKSLSGVLTESLMKFIAFALTYAVITFLIQLLATIVLSPLGFFTGTVNRGGGFFFGGLSAFVGLSVMVGLMNPFLSLAGPNSFWNLIQKAQFYPYLVYTFSYLVDIFRLNLDSGLTVPFDLTKIPFPEQIPLQNFKLN